jgi:glycine/D-amino acid oxidase-like deaminating enzyme
MIYDLIIVGGGMSGISVGHHFRDKNILILEKGSLLSGATGHNAGFVISGFGEHYAKTVSRLGRNRAHEIQTLHLKNHSMIQELARNFYRKIGSFTVSYGETEFHIMKQGYELLKSDGFHVDWIDSVDCGLKNPSPGILNHHDGVIDSVQFWNFLAADLPVRTNCAVTEIIDASTSVQLNTTQGKFEAEKVVFCLNAFSSELLPEFQGLYVPLRGQMLRLPLKLKPPTERPIITNYGEIYWHFTDTHINFGGLEFRVPEDETGIATDVSKRITDIQIDWIRQFMNPDLFASFEPVRTWCSTMAFTVDGFPFVGALKRPRCYVLAGLCGLGHSYALEAARWIHELITTGRNIIPEFCSSDRMNSLPRFEGGDWRNQNETWNHGIH